MIIGGQRSMNASTPIGRGLGISAGLEAGRARDLAVNCERLGYHSLWSNDEPTAAGLETLAQFAGVAPQLELGVGVLPLDRHQPVAIAAEIARLGLDPAKLWVGVGSGQLHAPIDLVRRAVAELRELLPEGTRIVVAAMRPRMCRLGGAIADGVLLNWIPPEAVPQSVRQIEIGAKRAGKNVADLEIAAFIRTLVTDDPAPARAWLARDITGYVIVDSYARFFAGCGFGAEVEAVSNAWKAGDRAGAVRQISERFLDGLGVVGPAEFCRQRLAEFAKAGLTQPVVIPLPPDSDPKATVARTLQAVAA